MDYHIFKGDVLETCQQIDDHEFDAVFCDPPYGLNFMGRSWDHGVPSAEVWAEIMRTMKPGAHLMAFGGTRTYHRLACNIEDAGFEIRDCFMYLYGSGFPKAYDISKGLDKKAIVDCPLCDGEGVHRVSSDSLIGLCEDHEEGGVWQIADGDDPECMYCGKRLTEIKKQEGVPVPCWKCDGEGKIKGAEREKIGQGKWANRASSVSPMTDQADREDNAKDDRAITAPATEAARRFDGYKTALKPAWEPIIVAMKPKDGTYVDNALEHGVSGLNVDGGRIGEQGGTKAVNFSEEDHGTVYGNGKGKPKNEIEALDEGRFPANLILDAEAGSLLDEQAGDEKSRFFYTAKASKAEREAGLEETRGTTDDGRKTAADNAYQRGKTKRKNVHPCVKPLDLCRYFTTLLLPPERDTPRRIMIPYSGSGSEMIGAMLAGWDQALGIELDPEDKGYIEIAKKRLEYWRGRSL